MLNDGALAGKPFKKKIYLAYLRMSGLLNKAYWHATSPEEADNIIYHFPRNNGVLQALNIPKVPFSNISFIPKTAGQLKLVSLSLISEHKNILLLVQLLATFNQNVHLDIYGPVTDELYWKKCEALIKQFPLKVCYKGDIKPADVQQVLLQYHLLILLTKGENFGHSIYESMSVGRPVITSHFTPWSNLNAKMGGVNVDINNRNDCLQALGHFYNMEQQEFDAYCLGAHQVAREYFTSMNTDLEYKRLFA
jgi:glycosyltransferase involved in cell wall biosynthesis